MHEGGPLLRRSDAYASADPFEVYAKCNALADVICRSSAWISEARLRANNPIVIGRQTASLSRSGAVPPSSAAAGIDLETLGKV